MSDQTLTSEPNDVVLGKYDPRPEGAYNVNELKQRGWTDASIRRFLGEPDWKKRNPVYATAAPVRFYCCDRVAAAEASPEYRDWLEKSKVRSENARKKAERRKAELLEWVDEIEITIPKIDDVTENAVRHYNAYWEDSEKRASINDDEEFLARITVNYLRHMCSKYERQLAVLFGRPGADEAYRQLKIRILEAIARTYPDLMVECDKQTVRVLRG